MHGTTIVAGPARTGKTRWLLERYRAQLAAGGPGTALWLAPTQRAAAEIRQQLLTAGGAACLNPQCLTFEQFARRVLDASSRPLRPLGMLGQRRLLEQVISRLLADGTLQYFRPIAHTDGFLDLVQRQIQELKRLEIWPEELRDARAARENAKDRELYALYAEYQRILHEHRLYDAQGRFWSARAEMRGGHFGPFRAVRSVFVDGFVDFTRTEREMLELLSGQVESTAISLPLEIGSPRTELFAKPAATLAALQSRFADLHVVRLDRTPQPSTAIDHLERFLFSNPHAVAAPPEPVEIEIVPAAGVTAEIEWLARRIKALLVEGDPATGTALRPADVLVVFRALTDEIAGLVRQVFDEYGVPLAIGNRQALAASPIARTLAAWLQLDADDWPFGQLLALLVRDFFQPSWPEWRQGRAAWAAEAVVRRLQIPSGRAALLTQLERMAASAAESGESVDYSSGRLTRQAALAAPLLARMARMLDALPERATIAQWTDACQTLAADSGMLRAASDADRGAWQAVLAGLAEVERVNHWLARDADYSRRDFAELLRDVLRSQALPVDADEVGRVRVLSADGARHVAASFVFLAGLSERSFPPAEREDCLYGEAEMRELVAAGLPMSARAERRWHEMLLFYQVVTRATRRLVLSYAALDDAAQPLSPSPYVSEVERVFAARPIVPTARPSPSAVPASDTVYSPRELRVRAAAQALAGNSSLLKRLARHPLTRSTSSSILAGLAAIRARREKDFGPFKGMLESSEAQRLLAGRFGPEHCWSPSQLEQYARCPFQFFLERVLGVAPCEDPVLAVDYAGRGQLLHQLLATLHRRLNEAAGRPTAPGELSAAAFGEQLAQLVGELLPRRPGDRPLADGLLEIDVRRMAAQLAAYYEQHADYDLLHGAYEVPLRPAHFEVPFGPQRGPDSDNEDLEPLGSEHPFELEIRGEIIRFAGRIDRVDLGQLAGQVVFSIVDYKSGRSESAKIGAIVDGAALQLPLYALATESLLKDQNAVPVRIGYWHVAGKGCTENLALAEIERGTVRPNVAWKSLLDNLPKRVLSLVRGVRQGQFPMASDDPKCTSRCGYSTVCRVNQVRAMETHASWQPPEEDAP